ncbi:hypothetical protein GCM10027176_86480 [Actinoallomurus bryophytorum]|uniref:Uncharacterized protein n=1 Tax=Actinoallomurus bryophytorum TaxID=1490222 RepID=A0A543CSV9_9ACTN|nr:hypothetical protein [Actinoallomurus bryophytorum]TQM00101.1 hypothetical protein FB559_5807 [Actinoallomurus bryophytorum]
MTAQGAGIPAYDSTVAEEPRRPGSVRRYASIGRRVAKATFYTFAIVFVTGIFVGLLMGMTNAHADDGGSGGDGGSSSSGTSSSSGGDGGSSSSSGDGGSSSSDGGDGGSSASDGGDGGSSASDGGDGGSSDGTGDSSSSSDGGDSSATDTQSVATSHDATSDDSSAEASSDTPSTKVNGEATSVDGISVSHVSVGSPDPSSTTLGSPTAAEAASAQQGEATATAQATETAAQQAEAQTTDPSADAVAAAAVPGTVVDNAVTAPPDTAVAADPATDDVAAAAAAVPGVSIATPEETAAVADAQALAKAATAPMDTSVAADPDGTLTPGDPATDVAAAAAAVPGVTVTDPTPTEIGHKVTVGADFALGVGMGLALTYQDHPYALGMKVRTWLGLGAQAYGLVTPAIEPGPKTVTYFVQGQVGVPETPVVAGVEVDYMPNKPPDDQVAIAPYLGVQYPFQNKPWGNVWGVEQTPRNVKTGEQSAATKSVGYGWGGMVGVAAGASELGADPASIGFVSPPANISMHMMH